MARRRERRGSSLPEPYGRHAEPRPGEFREGERPDVTGVPGRKRERSDG